MATPPPDLLLFLFFLLLFTPLSISNENDTLCLQGIKSALTDPNSLLSSWNFNSTTIGYLCKFDGVICWNQRENRINSLQLSNLNLSGQIPSALQFCSSLQTLDFSSNQLSGPIPDGFCSWVPFLVSLDLSGNRIKGTIPGELGECKYLNELSLEGNELVGAIPRELAGLNRLVTFSVANNELKGPIPAGLSRFGKGAFEGNGGLCGKPLGKCGG
ncbi:hypothetical protein Droror1_Dr00010841 [Drosera rotundifolia]